MNLVIIESPNKIKTISQYLGSDFKVVATKGHIRDIKDCGVDNLGLDEKNGLKPIYEIIPRQHQTIKYLNEAIKNADNVYLATDPDREGEAISWHLRETLNLKGKNVKRIEFNEITEPAIKAALENPRDIDERLFESQETRKIFDRIIGYKITGILKRSVGSDENNISPTGGRVQSAALRIIIDKENAIKAFVPEKFFEIEAEFDSFKAKLMDPNKLGKTYSMNDEAEALKIMDGLGNGFVVESITPSKRYEKPQPPFTTSSLIQTALNRLNMSSKKTMKTAQELYEGVELNGKHIAFITYMRTDSTRMSDVFQKQLYRHIVNNYGQDHVGALQTKNNNDNAQDAHEAIRPVNLRNTPEQFKDILSKEQYNLYSLIYNRAVESMMKSAEYEVKTVVLDNNGYKFYANFEKLTFDGFKANSGKQAEAKAFNKELGDYITSINPPQLLRKETEGPKRFTEATLTKEMESSGIGRPSTYVSTIETLKARKYVQIQKKQIVPTDQGMLVSNFLDDHFNSVININYTASMEETLDNIAKGDDNESEVVPEFYENFNKVVEEEKKLIKPLETGETCPICGSPMVYKSNRYGRFEACSNYPNCKYIKKEEKQKEELMIPCPECGEGHLVQRVAKFGSRPGRKFYGCSNYPKCKFTQSSLSGIKKAEN